MALSIAAMMILLLALTWVGASYYGAFRWQVGTQALRDRLHASRGLMQPKSVDLGEMNGLPAPVQRYFRKAIQDGQSMVTGVQMRHRGTFNLGETTDQWQPFTSDQQVTTHPPGFDWNGRVDMLPGIPVLVHDAYIAGEGILQAALLGLFSLVNLRGTEDMARGELMRFLAEAAWYPTALLPSQGISWTVVNDHSAQGTLTDNGLSVTMLFTFNEQDLIESIQADGRGRTVGGRVIPTPWYGHFWNYEERSGMQVPLEGEVAWLLPDGPKPYWRGTLTEIAYQFSH
ncbi:MAG: hypothetical protein OHK0012_10640 [Synechococcales cyanobacterium]